jgi:hypothetical protein
LNTSPARIAIKTSPAACNNVGVKELISNFNDYVFTFPNPTNDILNINITKVTPSNLKCEIYNSQGQVVKTISQLEFHNSINVDNLANGLYVVKVYNTEVSAVKKITILR